MTPSPLFSSRKSPKLPTSKRPTSIEERSMTASRINAPVLNQHPTETSTEDVCIRQSKIGGITDTTLWRWEVDQRMPEMVSKYSQRRRLARCCGKRFFHWACINSTLHDPRNACSKRAVTYELCTGPRGLRNLALIFAILCASALFCGLEKRTVSSAAGQRSI